tara:strand:- start:209 stop:403 length:195 start_codon:yes stop_codon:yes gene_type:complete
MPIPDHISEQLWAMIRIKSGFGIQSKLEKENTENKAKWTRYAQFCFFMFTECRSLHKIQKNVLV